VAEAAIQSTAAFDDLVYHNCRTIDNFDEGSGGFVEGSQSVQSYVVIRAII
jgi:hypothetical protein